MSPAKMAIADIVIMGGTFSNRIGGHSLYEPAVLGKPIIGGPHYHSFPDIGAELVRNGVYRTVNNRSELLPLLAAEDFSNGGAIAAAAMAAVDRRKGALSCILDRIAPYIEH